MECIRYVVRSDSRVLCPSCAAFYKVRSRVHVKPLHQKVAINLLKDRGFSVRRVFGSNQVQVGPHTTCVVCDHTMPVTNVRYVEEDIRAVTGFLENRPLLMLPFRVIGAILDLGAAVPAALLKALI